MPVIVRERRKPGAWPVTAPGGDPEWAWAWRGLVFAAMPSRQWQWELLTRQLGQLTGAVDWDEATEMGSALNRLGSATDGGAYWPRPAQLAQITNQCTILIWIQTASVSQVDAFLSIPYRNTGWTSPFVSLRLIGPRVIATGPQKLEFSYATNSSTLVRIDSPDMDVSNDAGDGRVHVYGVTRSGSTVTFYRDGANRGTGSGGNTTNVDWGTGSNVVVGTRSDASTGESMDGKFVLALIYDRPLSDAEIAQLAVDPFGPFRIRQPVKVGTAHAGAAALAGIATIAPAATSTGGDVHGFATATSAALHGLAIDDAAATGSAAAVDAALGGLVISDG